MPLTLTHRADRAAQHVIRARIFFDLWFYFEEHNSRAKILTTMREYNEFFRFAPHSFLSSFIIYISGLFETRGDTINFVALHRELRRQDNLSKEDDQSLSQLLADARPIVSKVKLLRDNVFAHKTIIATYDDVFDRAAVTPHELRDLTEIALKIANILLRLCGRQQQYFAKLPLDAAERMMRELQAR